MTDQEAKTMLAELTKHFGCRVAPVNEYCAAFKTYFRVADAYIRDSYPKLHAELGTLNTLISKSCLLDRMIYQGQEPGIVPCPDHDGRWSGIHFPAPDCGCATCCTTGWLPR